MSECDGLVGGPGEVASGGFECCSAMEGCRTSVCGLYYVDETAQCERSESNLAFGVPTPQSRIAIVLEVVPPYQIALRSCENTRTNNQSNLDFLYHRN